MAAPSGPAGGDLGFTYPNPHVISLSHVPQPVPIVIVGPSQLNPRFTASHVDPLGVDGDFWLSLTDGLFRVRLNGSWHSLLGNVSGNDSWTQPNTGYNSAAGVAGLSAITNPVTQFTADTGIVTAAS